MVAIDSNALFYAACGGLTLGAACTINYVVRGKDTGMTRIAYNIATMKKCNFPTILRVTALNIVHVWWHAYCIIYLLSLIWKRILSWVLTLWP